MFNVEDQVNLWNKISQYKLETYEHNNWISIIDASILYGFIKYFKPLKIIEIGAGFSTKISLSALSNEGSMITIDPDIGRITIESSRLTVLPKRLEEVDLSIFSSLKENDIVFIDSSHVWKQGNDVDLEYYYILPHLDSGVIVHIHDIFLPDTYSDLFASRGLNEQFHVEKMLKSGEWEILLSTYFLKKMRPDLFPNEGAGSLWIRKR